MIMRLCLVPVTVIMILLQTTVSVTSQNTAVYTHHFCLANGTANGNTFTAELNALLDNLSSKSASQSFFNYSSDTLSSLYLCRGDDTPDACRDCVATAIRDIRSRCPFGREAIIWYNECMVRYSNQSFLGILQYSPGVFMWNINNNTSPNEPDSWALSLVDRLVAEAPVSELKYRADVLAVADGMRTEQRYALVQCSRDISVDNCRVCLRRLTDEIQDCCQGKKGWRILTPSCNIRYEEYSFFRSPLAPSGSPPPGNPTNSSKRKKSTSKIILAIVLPISAVVMVVFGFLFFRCNKRTEKGDDRGRSQVILMSNEYKDEDGMDLKDDEDDSAGDIHFFDISTIEAATNNFSAANKLGQGGFGPVYKGKLLNGKEIAVKRLSRNSGQGVGEFKTEVRLIVKLQHRNLVRLLGCCIERKEKLLIYEYLPNLSLDAFLFDATRSRELDWAKRANIIQGIAKGLLYLHEDSRLKIIHRDLKASNILLDEDMDPKISDFGTARIVGGNQMEVSTQRIVGTYGYMAPEYAMEGIFSVKSDVYSFGVMLLEIVSGKKNSTSFGQMPHVQNLLSYAWKQWNSGKMEEFIDGAIVENGSIEEAVKWTNIALLCVQENPETRPTMSAVVMMLGNQWTSLPRPAEAPFSVRHFSTNEAHDSVSSPFSVRHIFQQSWSHEVDTVSVNSSHQTSTSASN